MLKDNSNVKKGQEVALKYDLPNNVFTKLHLRSTLREVKGMPGEYDARKKKKASKKKTTKRKTTKKRK